MFLFLTWEPLLDDYITIIEHLQYDIATTSILSSYPEMEFEISIMFYVFKFCWTLQHYGVKENQKGQIVS